MKKYYIKKLYRSLDAVINDIDKIMTDKKDFTIQPQSFYDAVDLLYEYEEYLELKKKSKAL